MITLTSSRLVLRELALTDSPFIFELLNDPQWLKHIGDRSVNNIQGAEVYIQQGPQKMYRKMGMGLLLVESKISQQPMGLCGLLKRDELPHPDLGFAFLPEYRGQGLVFEAAKLVLADAFKRELSQKILAITSIDNHKSIQLLEKLGFNFKGFTRLENNSDETKLFELLV